MFAGLFIRFILLIYLKNKSPNPLSFGSNNYLDFDIPQATLLCWIPKDLNTSDYNVSVWISIVIILINGRELVELIHSEGAVDIDILLLLLHKYELRRIMDVEFELFLLCLLQTPEHWHTLVFLNVPVPGP